MNVPIIIIRCQWEEYYDFRLMTADGCGHVRVSFFPDETIISDLYVVEGKRKMGYATRLLDEVDKLVGNKPANIVAIHCWQKEWYIRRGYLIKED